MVLMLLYEHVVCHVKLSIQTRAALELTTIASQARVQGKSGDRIEPLAAAAATLEEMHELCDFADLFYTTSAAAGARRDIAGCAFPY